MKILFVCLGNICRSPMAEFVLKDLCKDKNYEISSAGTSNYHSGEDMHKGTKDILKAKNIQCNGFSSKQINEKMCKYYDLILTMDESNYEKVCISFPNYKHKIKRLCDYCDLGYNKVPDPYYTLNFDEVFMVINNSCKNLLKELQ